jgi:hypothetical protein
MKDLLADFDEYGNVGKHWDSVVRVREVLGKAWSGVMDDLVKRALEAARSCPSSDEADGMRAAIAVVLEEAAKLAETSKGYPTYTSERIRALGNEQEYARKLLGGRE